MSLVASCRELPLLVADVIGGKGRITVSVVPQLPLSLSSFIDGPPTGLGPAPPPKLVWHYTRHDNLAKILGSHPLWATSVSYMNDLGEISLGVRRLRRVLKALRHQGLSPKEQSMEPDWDQVRDLIRGNESVAYAASAFAVSFSKDGDDNAQWDRYAGRDGFAIGFERGTCMPVLGDVDDEAVRWWATDEPLRWRDMLYTKARQKQRSTEAIRSMWEQLQQNPYP